MTTYKPFCSLECNREYSATVAGGGYGHGANDEPYCLNCGARTEAMTTYRQPSRRQAAGDRYFIWRGNSQGELVQPISGPYRTAQEAEQNFPPGGAYPFFVIQSGPNTSWPGTPYEARRRTAHRHPTDPPRRRATRRRRAPSLTCPRCGSHVEGTVYQDTPTVGRERLVARCDECGWSGQKEKQMSRHAARGDTYEAWGCVDCLMFVANGEPPLTDPATGREWSQAEEEAWVQAWVNRNQGVTWHLGDDEQEFSWSACHLCGSTLGGSRHEFHGFGD